ncbi:restriction endonuclease subunit S [Bacteroides fragilis]|uniref:restriction endonuclease subunit S n=5 Tax=Bacteroides fragilis TaxID=817 RepID=UPI0004515065|nr:restriction endonuclease subunit S [Bacteroides fragilis]EXY10692.1 type I restriction modification DNA specificity domain protein [Bacteroides fragilis str. 1007-1-F \
MADNKNNSERNVPPLRFPEFSGEWKKCTIGGLTIKVGSGVTPRGGEAVYKTEGHPFVRSQNVGLGHLLLDDIAYIDEDTHQRQKNTELQLDDVLLNITGASIGRSAIVTKEIVRGNVNQHVCIIRTKDNLVSSFLCNFLLSNYGQKQIDSFQAGGNRQGLNFEQIKSIKIAIPTVNEQSKIAQLLQLVEERIATQNKIIEKYESLIKGLNNILLYGTEGKYVCLGDILLERSERSRTNNQHEVLSSTVKGIFSQREYFSKDIASENNVGYKIIRLHDVVLSPQNLWMGNINYNDRFDIGIVSPSYKVFSIADGYDNQFVAAMLKTYRALYSYMMVSEQGASIVRRNLNMEAFLQLVFKIPSLDKQREIGCAISLLKSQLKTANKIIRAYTSQKKYLLRQMFI